MVRVSLHFHLKSLRLDEFMIWFCTPSVVWSWVADGNIWVIFDVYIIDLDIFWVWLILIWPFWFITLFVFEKSICKFDFASSSKFYPLLFALLFPYIPICFCEMLLSSAAVPIFALKSPVIKKYLLIWHSNSLQKAEADLGLLQHPRWSDLW